MSDHSPSPARDESAAFAALRHRVWEKRAVVLTTVRERAGVRARPHPSPHPNPLPRATTPSYRATATIARGRGSKAFTLLETLATLLLLALLASAITLSFRAPLNRAKVSQAIEQLRFADTATRALAQKSARPAELIIDLDDNTLTRRDPRTGELLSRTQIPAPWRIAAFRTTQSNSETGQHTLRFSPQGLTQSYAVKLTGPDEQTRWVFFAGLSPDSNTDLDDSQIASILAAASPRRHAD